ELPEREHLVDHLLPELRARIDAARELRLEALESGIGCGGRRGCWRGGLCAEEGGGEQETEWREEAEGAHRGLAFGWRDRRGGKMRVVRAHVHQDRAEGGGSTAQSTHRHGDFHWSPGCAPSKELSS